MKFSVNFYKLQLLSVQRACKTFHVYRTVRAREASKITSYDLGGSCLHPPPWDGAVVSWAWPRFAAPDGHRAGGVGGAAALWGWGPASGSAEKHPRGWCHRPCLELGLPATMGACHPWGLSEGQLTPATVTPSGRSVLRAQSLWAEGKWLGLWPHSVPSVHLPLGLRTPAGGIVRPGGYVTCSRCGP